jgi:death-on-curing protein
VQRRERELQLRLDGRRLTFTNDQAYELVMKVAAGELDQVEEISAVLQGNLRVY